MMMMMIKDLSRNEKRTNIFNISVSSLYIADNSVTLPILITNPTFMRDILSMKARI